MNISMNKWGGAATVNKKLKIEDRCFWQGVLYAAATLVGIYEAGAAEQLVKEANLTWADLRKVGISPYDRSYLRKIKYAFKDEKKR